MINAQASALGATQYASASVTVDEAKKANLQSDLAAGDVTLTITGANGKSVATHIAQDASATPEAALGKFVEAINNKSSETGVTAYLSEDGSSLEYRATAAQDQSAAAVSVVATGSNEFAATAQVQSNQGLRGVDISTQEGAWEAINRIDSALNSIDSSRSDLGALQNRFQSTIGNLNATATNLAASRSRIEDADYAIEISNMTRKQILQQAGTAVLAQANQVPQGVLSLLR